MRFLPPEDLQVPQGGKCNKGADCTDYHANPQAKRDRDRRAADNKKKLAAKANVSLAKVMMVAACASAAFREVDGCSTTREVVSAIVYDNKGSNNELDDYFGCRVRNARTFTTSSDEDYGFASREGGSSTTTWRATTSMLSSRLWKATTSVQSTSAAASRKGSGSYRVSGQHSAAPSNFSPSEESDESIRIQIRFPEWVKRIAVDQEKNRLKYREARGVRDSEVYSPTMEMIRISEATARNEAYLQYSALVKMGRLSVIPLNLSLLGR